jgi:hypothetical protein
MNVFHNLPLMKTHDECFPQPSTDENNGMEFWDCCMWQGSPRQQFTGRIPNFQMEFLQNL